MQVSEWLRSYQISGEVPDFHDAPSMMAFWCGWLIGTRGVIAHPNPEQRIEMAIRAAEFIESQAR